MPTYEYRCLKCKKKFDSLQSIKAEPLSRCIYCKGKVERLISSGAGLIFKGTGFYATDYKKAPADQKKSAAAPASPAKETVSAKETAPAKEAAPAKKGSPPTAKTDK